MTRSLLIVLLITCASCGDGPREFAVTPLVETDPVPSSGDAADDIAVWVHPTDAGRSVIIGANKQDGGKGGLYVYGFDGKVIGSLTGKRMNNVDLRYGFTLGGKKVDLLAATNRTDETADLFTIDPDTRKLTQVGSIPLAKSLSGFRDPYGLALGVDRKTGAFHVIASDRRRRIAQFVLSEKDGAVTGTLVRYWAEEGTVEGIVVDDASGAVYVAEERVGIYRYGLVPAGPLAGAKAGSPPVDRKVIDTTKGNLTPDIEGLAIYGTTGDGGYLIASSQGNNRFVIYDRKTLAYVATFSIKDNVRSKIGGVNDTDGIEAVSGNLGPRFPQGAFIAQDGHNGESRQNFKVVSWQEIVENAGAKKIKLAGDGAFDPRK